MHQYYCTMAKPEKQLSMLCKIYFLLILVQEVLHLASFNSSFLVAIAGGASNQVRVEEVEALLKWKSNLDDRSHSILSSWNGSSPCSWIGINCDHFGSVISLNLSSLAIVGTLHNLNFSMLPNMVNLIAFNNSLFANVPPSIGDLPKLTWLDLSRNHFSGNIPTQLGSLRSLELFHLSSKQIRRFGPPFHRKFDKFSCTIP